MKKKISTKEFFNIILNGTALGIVGGLIPNAVLSALFKYLGTLFLSSFFTSLSQAVYLLQFSVPILVGVAIGYQMKFKPLESLMLGAAVLAGSGSLTYNDKIKAWTAVPMGDLFNVILVAIVGTLVIKLIQDKFGSLTIILLPIVGGGVPAAIGLYTLPYMKQVTKFLADIVLHFTTLQPILMCILIAISFSLFIVTPVSTVAMGIILFANENFLGAGAAALGVVSSAMVLAIGSTRAKNPVGVTVAIILGGIKMMMPNVAKRPIILLPIFITAAVTGLSGYFFNILGTKDSAGFGIIGLIGPVKAYEMSTGFLQVILSYFVIPFVVGFVVDLVLCKVLKLYKQEAYATKDLG